MIHFRIMMLVMQVASSLLLIGLSIPLVRRKIGPNAWYGFRVPKTLNNPVVWYEANAYSGKCLVGAGLFILIGALVLYLIPALDDPTYATVCAVVDLGALAVAVVLSFRFLGRIATSTHQEI